MTCAHIITIVWMSHLFVAWLFAFRVNSQNWSQWFFAHLRNWLWMCTCNFVEVPTFQFIISVAYISAWTDCKRLSYCWLFLAWLIEVDIYTLRFLFRLCVRPCVVCWVAINENKLLKHSFSRLHSSLFVLIRSHSFSFSPFLFVNILKCECKQFLLFRFFFFVVAKTGHIYDIHTNDHILSRKYCAHLINNWIAAVWTEK